MDRPSLSRLLVAARGRVQPGDVGMPAGPRRRVPGLRREEVAQLACISVDYLIRLEQGRGPKPSNHVLGALARALRMNDDERDHLFLLAGSEPPRDGRIDRLVRPGTARLMDRMSDVPVLVVDAMGGVLAWNNLALALVGDLTRMPQASRNFLRMRFLGEAGRVVYDSAEADEHAAGEAVADLRATAARYPDDPDLAVLLDDLLSGSELFRRLWEEGRVEVRRTSTKTFDHPQVGPLCLDCDVLLLPDSDQRVIVYSAAPGTTAAHALDLLRVIGTQDWATPS